jgi:hypothetical protein
LCSEAFFCSRESLIPFCFVKGTGFKEGKKTS